MLAGTREKEEERKYVEILREVDIKTTTQYGQCGKRMNDFTLKLAQIV